MSVDLYVACPTCKDAIHVAQDGLGGFTFYSGQPQTMRLLGDFLGDHYLCPEGVRFLPESVIDTGDYTAFDSNGDLLPND